MLDERVPEAEPAVYTTLGVADRLSCSVKHVERLPVPGRIKLGRLVRYDRKTVDAWIAAGCPKSTVN